MEITTELIEQYLAGAELDAETLQAIEAHLKQDEAMANQLAEKTGESQPDSILLAALSNAKASNIRERVFMKVKATEDQLASEGFFKNLNMSSQSEGNLEAASRKKLLRWGFVAFAALALVVTMFWYFTRPQYPSAHEIDKWFPSQQKQELIRQLQDELNGTGAAFVQNDVYQTLIAALEKSTEGPIESAKNDLENIVREHPEIDMAQFYLAEALLRQQEVSQAQQILSRLAKKQGKFQSSAKKILADM